MWKQLHFEFIWPDLSEKEIKRATESFVVRSTVFFVVDLFTFEIYTQGDLIKCKRDMINAKIFYNKFPGYLGSNRMDIYYKHRHFQLLFKP